MAVGFRDYYETLGVARTASDEEIRSAYRRLAREYHPDVNKDPGAEDRFKEVSEAYEVLRDPEKRERYDRLGPRWKTGEDVSGAAGFGGGGAGGFGDYGDVRVDFGTGGFGGGFGAGGGFSDFFESLFGGRAGGRRTGGFEGFSTRGGDVEATIDISLEEAARGGRRRIALTDGREYEVEIPVGVREGQRIRLAGEGTAGPGGGPAGDLYLRVEMRPHPRFRREGNDLHMQLPVAPWEAVLGASVSIQTLSGRARVRVPAGSSCGRRLRLRGQGIPPDGDLYATVSIDVPKNVDQEPRELWERLAEVSSFDPRRAR